MADNVVTWQVEVGGRKHNYAKTYSNNGQTVIDAEPVADAQTDQLYTVAIDVSAVSSFFIVASGGALTVETNSGSSPTNTLSLVDGVPYVWTSDSYDTFKLTGDVTALYFTNASGATVTVYAEVQYDGSP